MSQNQYGSHMTILLLVLTVLATPPGELMARTVRRHPSRYGHTTQLAPSDTPLSPYNLAAQAGQDTTAWWANQGSAPPPLDLQIAPGQDGEHIGYGYFHSGRVTIDPKYLQGVATALAGAGTRQGKIAALVGLWQLMAHERGHNIGYDHDRGGIMSPLEQQTGAPGRAYEWAASELPRKRVIRRR